MILIKRKKGKSLGDDGATSSGLKPLQPEKKKEEKMSALVAKQLLLLINIKPCVQASDKYNPTLKSVLNSSLPGVLAATYKKKIG